VVDHVIAVAAPDPPWGEHFQPRRLGDRRSGGTFGYAEPFTRLG
jgi:putative acetyltransferase